MKKVYFILLGLIFIGLVGEVWAVPSFPHTFYGTVKKDGANVPDGTVVSALIGGVSYGSGSTATSGGDSVYSLNVLGDNPDTPQKEGGVNGDTVSFTVGSDTADQTVIFSSGSTTNLPLTVTTRFTLTINIAPPGAGYVSKSPSKSAYNSGEQVQLTATANPGYTFSGWSGGASGMTNPITITMNGNQTVTANFTQDHYTLTVSVVPSGVGSVTRSPDQPTYVYGSQVQLTATANPGYTFSGWSGGASGTTNPITITMNGNTSITANFTQGQYSLTVSVSPSGVGLVMKNPNKSTYMYGEQVQLTATANPGYTFSGWSGGASGMTNPITITMNGNTSITVNFTQGQYSLTVSVSPSGVGSVTKSPDKATYVYGDVVTLTATANPGYTFSTWSGDASSSQNPITITIDNNKSVASNFVRETISTPNTPIGPTNGSAGVNYAFSTGGSSSSQGPIEYQFDWGDGTNSGWLSAGVNSTLHFWNPQGTYLVRAQARCSSDTSVVSGWSGALSIVISEQLPMIGVLEYPTDGQKVSGVVAIYGWALDGKGIAKIELFIDDQFVTNIPYGSRRSDIQEDYPDYPDSEDSGFATVYDFWSFSMGPHAIKVRFHNQDGHTQDIIANVVVKKFHGDFVTDVTPGSEWLQNLSVTIDGVTKIYNVRLEWSEETQGFVITEIIPE